MEKAINFIVQHTTKKLILFTFLFLITVSTATAAVRYVTQSGAGSKDGSSWSNASDDPQEMINLSASGDSVWIAIGIYKPTHSADGWTDDNPTGVNDNPQDPQNSFVLKSGVKVFGGFPADGGDFSERNWITHRTILSGDFEGNDFGNDSSHQNSSENAFHVVITAGNTQGTLLDGFTIWGGGYCGESHYANNNSVSVNGETVLNRSGGGIYAVKSAASISNLEIRRNGGYDGGGLYCIQSSDFRGYNLYFFKNFAAQGGAMYVKDRPKFKNLIISENEAGMGTAISNSQSYSTKIEERTAPHYINTFIHANLGSPDHGFGAIHNEAADPVFTNTTIAGNFGGNHTALFNYVQSGTTLNNTIIWNNKNSIESGFNYESLIANVYNSGDSHTIYNNCLIQNMDMTAHNGLDATADNFDPKFLHIPTHYSGSFILMPNSPCIDAGSNELYMNACGDDFSGWDNELALTPPPYSPFIDWYDSFFGNWCLDNIYANKEAPRLGGERVNIGAFEATFIPPAILLADWQYGTPNTPDVAYNPENGKVTYYYDTSASGTFLSIQQPADVGTYYVKAKIDATNNYESVVTLPIAFTINKASFDATVSLDNWTYGNTAKVPVVNKNPENSKVTYYYATSALGTFSSTEQPKSAGTYYVKAKIDATKNYNECTTQATAFTIKKAPQNITFNPQRTLSVKNGSYTLTATSTSRLPVLFKVDNDDLAEITGQQLILKKAGTVKVTAYVEPDPNFENATEVTVSITLEAGVNIVTVKADGTAENLFVFPNPVASGSVIQIILPVDSSGTLQNESIEVYDMTGQFVRHLIFSTESNVVEIPLQLPAGSYILKWKKYETVLMVK